jgi:predicted site-specific integrase-resolvase
MQINEETKTDQLIPVLTSTEARKALGISRSTEHRWMSKGILQPTHIGTRKHYLLADINDLITEGAS